MNDKSQPFLPYGKQDIDDADIAAVTAVLRSDYLTTGPVVDAFEHAFANTVGAKHAIACSSGTAGLHLAAMALDLGPGDTVIVPTLTFVATANAATFTGATVAFCDVDPATGLAGPDDIEAAIGRANGSARAIFVVHLNGQATNMTAIQEVAQRHGLPIVEDACHALGGTYTTGPNATGQPGDCATSAMAVFSLHPVKAITMGEGGVVTTNSDELATLLRRARSHGITRDPSEFTNTAFAFDEAGQANPWYYEMAAPGLNYRASDINCALGLSQLGKLPQIIARRQALADQYDALLAPLSPMIRPVARTPWSHSAFHLYVAHIDYAAAGVSRAKVMNALRDHGIGSQVHYLPVHHQPYYANLNAGLVLPGADEYYAQSLSLPLYPTLRDEDVVRVVSTLRDIVGIA